MDWMKKVRDAVYMRNNDMFTLNILRNIEDMIRQEYLCSGLETKEHLDAISLICAYKMQIIKNIDMYKDQAMQRAISECRDRYID